MIWNFDWKYRGKRALVAVGQIPFESNGRYFSTLVPLCTIDGYVISERNTDFPSHGDIWWMVTTQTRSYAEPGRLLTATLEEAVEQERADKAYYQVIPDSLDAVREDQFVEVLAVVSAQVTQARDIVLQSFSMIIDHPPCAIVYARWKDSLYGPLYASSELASPGRHQLHLKPARDDRMVFELPLQSVQSYILDFDIKVSCDTRPVYQSGISIPATYALMPSQILSPLLERARTEIWRTPGEVVREVTRRLFDRRLIVKKERQNFVRAFEEVETILMKSPEQFTSPEELNIFELIKCNLENIQKEAQDLADDLIASGLIDDKVEAGIDRRVNEYIEKNSAQLRARIEQQVEDRQRELDSLGTRMAEQEAGIAAYRKRRMEEVDQEVFDRRAQLDAREREIHDQAKDLKRERQIVVETLQEVSKKLSNDKDGLVRHFLTLVPLLREFDFLPNISARQTTDQKAEPSKETAFTPKLTLSPFIHRSSVEDRCPVDEIAFFERFLKYVKDSGFWHRRIDLVSMHLSCKCNDLTILGGQPGTGKSSLPRLYSEAMMGDDLGTGDRYLHLGVSPSWVDGRDLLGFVNAFERSFQPSESGLYTHLVNAYEEDRTQGGNSGVWLICLDEMNLAQVEHYFGAFIQALERPLGQRCISCFAPECVSPDNSFHRWATLYLGPNIRFVGTINFDETTRQLSQRLLDRANLIRLRPPRTDPESPAAMANQKPAGIPVNIFSLNEWRKFGERVPPEIGKILDELEEPLLKLGCALNPRRTRSIASFIANAPGELCSPQEALDLQVAQRLLPRIRGLFKTGAQQHFDKLRLILEARGGFSESLAVMREIAEEGLVNITAFDVEEL